MLLLFAACTTPSKTEPPETSMQDGADQSDYYWSPSGWSKSSSVTTRPVWHRKGLPVYETNEQYTRDSNECSKEAGIDNSKAAPRDQMAVWFECMWNRDWRREPVRNEKSFP